MSSRPFDVGAAPDEVAHGIFRFDPGASGHRPAGAILHGKLQAHAVAFIGHMFNQIVPLRAESLDLGIDSRPGPAFSVKEVEALKPGGMDGFDIRGQERFVHVATNQVKPGFWQAFMRGLLEVGIQRSRL